MNTFCDYHYLICRNLAYQPLREDAAIYIYVIHTVSLLLLFFGKDFTDRTFAAGVGAETRVFFAGKPQK